MPSLKNFSQLFDKVKAGNVDTYNTLKSLDIALDTTLLTSDSKETFISALIQSPNSEMFHDLFNSTLKQNGPRHTIELLTDMFQSSEGKGVYQDLSSGETKSLFQQAFEGGQPWAVQDSYENYRFCASEPGAFQWGLPAELPGLSQVYGWTLNSQTSATNFNDIILSANMNSNYSLKEWTTSEHEGKPVIFDFIARDESDVMSRVDYFENKYEDFDVNKPVGAHSVLTALIENNNLREALKLHEKGYLDITRDFTSEESERVAEHGNILISKMTDYTTRAPFKGSIFEELLNRESSEAIAERPEHIKASDVTNFLDYVKAIDETKFILSKDIDRNFMASEINQLISIKDQADFISFNEMVRKDFNPKSSKPSLK